MWTLTISMQHHMQNGNFDGVVVVVVFILYNLVSVPQSCRVKVTHMLTQFLV
jgi:hypothetical protein